MNNDSGMILTTLLVMILTSMMVKSIIMQSVCLNIYCVTLGGLLFHSLYPRGIGDMLITDDINLIMDIMMGRNIVMTIMDNAI